MAKFTSVQDMPVATQEKLQSYFSHIGGDTFAITGLPPELTAAALARYSRAPTGMQTTIVNEFLDENGEPKDAKGTEVIDRVVNAYGDDSVAELAVATIGVEKSSQLLTKQVEDFRLGLNPIEQSTRYVRYDEKEKPQRFVTYEKDHDIATTQDDTGRWRYVRPREVRDAGLLPLFEQTNDQAFETYAALVKQLTPLFEKQLPRATFQIEVERDGVKTKATEAELVSSAEQKAFNTAYIFTIRAAALDVGRCVLPSSTETHLGFVANGRALTYLITTLKSHELQEMRERGSKLEDAVATVIPTFIKRNTVDASHTQRNERMRGLARSLFTGITPQDGYVDLVIAGPGSSFDLEEHVLAYSLFPYTNLSFQQILREVKDFPRELRESVHTAYVGERTNRRDHVERGLEAMYPLTFDLVGGFAEYRDLHRHRILTQQRQPLTMDLGFIIPPELEEIGMRSAVEDVVGEMQHLNSEMRHAGLETASQYATLFNNRIRWVMGMNVRELQHLTELRTQPAGHFSYRAMTQEMARHVTAAQPWTENYLQFIDYSDPNNKIARAAEQSKIAGKNLRSGIDGGIDL